MIYFRIVYIKSMFLCIFQSLDKNVSIPDSEGRAFDAKVILSRCATYMAERAMRHIREEFAYVQLSNFKFCFTLPTFWASTKDFLMDVLSVVYSVLILREGQHSFGGKGTILVYYILQIV